MISQTNPQGTPQDPLRASLTPFCFLPELEKKIIFINFHIRLSSKTLQLNLLRVSIDPLGRLDDGCVLPFFTYTV